MSIIVEWDSRLITGNAIIDRQHQDILTHVNALILALINFKNQKDLCKIIRSLLYEVEFHTRTEEEFLRQIKHSKIYTHSLKHKAMLSSLIKILCNLYVKFSEKDAILLKTIIVDHLSEDLEWIVDLKNNGN